MSQRKQHSSHSAGSGSKPPKDGKYAVGFKGKGMCAHCDFSDIMLGKRHCAFYNGSSCQQVSRNCTGIKILRNR